MRMEVQTVTHLRILALFSLIAVVFLSSACDGTRLPRVVASYPQQVVAQQSPALTEARVEMSVRDVSRAAGEVADLAIGSGGTVLDEQHWRSREGIRASLSLLLPARRIHSFLRGLQNVGDIVSERLTESGGYAHRDTRVTVILYEEGIGAPDRGWNPTRTFSSALAVFLRLFQTLVDGLIWIVVVAGPFVLMGVGLLAVLRRLRQDRSGL